MYEYTVANNQRYKEGKWVFWIKFPYFVLIVKNSPFEVITGSDADLDTFWNLYYGIMQLPKN